MVSDFLDERRLAAAASSLSHLRLRCIFRVESESEAAPDVAVASPAVLVVASGVVVVSTTCTGVVVVSDTTAGVGAGAGAGTAGGGVSMSSPSATVATVSVATSVDALDAWSSLSLLISSLTSFSLLLLFSCSSCCCCCLDADGGRLLSSCQRAFGERERLKRLRSPDMGTSLMHDSERSVLVPRSSSPPTPPPPLSSLSSSSSSFSSSFSSSSRCLLISSTDVVDVFAVVASTAAEVSNGRVSVALSESSFTPLLVSES